jgi:hypothetical protein
VSVGHIFHVGERFKSLPLIWPTLYKSAAFLVFLIILNALEEITAGLIHHRAIAESLAEFGGGTLALSKSDHSDRPAWNTLLAI